MISDLSCIKMHTTHDASFGASNEAPYVTILFNLNKNEVYKRSLEL